VNIVIDVYAISGLARAEKITARGGGWRRSRWTCTVFASDAADRCAAKQVARALAGRSSGGAAELIAAVAAPRVDTVGARRRIADAVVRLAVIRSEPV
jgi:hypothetical protein